MPKCMQVLCMNVCISCLSVTLLLAGVTAVVYAIIVLAIDINPEFRDLALNQTFTYIPYGLFFLFIVFALVAAVGCFTHIKQNQPCMFIFFVLLLITSSVILICSIMLTTVGKKYMKESYEQELKNSMSKYDRDERLTNTWDQLQSQQQCCGYTSSTDWNGVDINGRRSVFPDSCCISKFELCGQSAKTSQVFSEGCEEIITETIDTVIDNLFVCSLGFALAMIIAMVFTLCTMCRSDDIQQPYTVDTQKTPKMKDEEKQTPEKSKPENEKISVKDKLKGLFRKK